MPQNVGAATVNPMRGRVVRHGHTPASMGNVANIVTVVRILLAPVFIWMLLADAGHDGLLRYFAAALFILAIVTDSVDGLLARRQNLVTDFGKILDPIADKVLVGGALIALSILSELPWWVTIVILVREVGITAYRFVALRDRVIPASWLGKLKTVVQAVAISFALVPLDRLLGAWYAPLAEVMVWVNTVLMAAALVLTVLSGIEYLWQAWRVSRTPKPGAAAPAPESSVDDAAE